MRVYVLSSGSSGNAAIVEAEGTRILLDAGIGPKKAVVAMRALGEDIYPRGFDAIVVSHHHGDHCAHLEPHARASGAPVYLHAGVEAPRVRRRFEVREYDAGAHFKVGALTVRTIPLPHDAPQIAISVASGSRRFGIATDLGYAPKPVVDFLGACDVVMLEANYCERLLDAGPYPPKLKRRVAGDLGHLSNDQTAEIARALMRQRVARLYLCHLSRSNNSPARALETVKARATGLHVEVVPHGAPFLVDVVASGRVEQLSLAF
ncbi:MAG TPA: MBL fold metallo-hydrolase [Polyangiaceae bacterium]